MAGSLEVEMPEKELKDIYGFVSSKFDSIPDYETFAKNMQDEEKRKQTYEFLSGRFTQFPAYERFSEMVDTSPSFGEQVDEFNRPLYSAASGVVRAGSHMWKALDNLTEYLSEQTGLERGGLFESLAQSADNMANALAEKGVTGEDAAHKILKYVYEGAGQAIGEIPQYIAGGLAPVAGIKGASESIEQGENPFKGLLKGFTEGLLLGKALKYAEGLPTLAKPAAGGAIFGVPSLMQTLSMPEDQRDWSRAVADMFVGAGMMVPSMMVPGKSFAEIKKDFMETYGVNIDAVAQRAKTIDSEFVRSKKGVDVTERAAAIKQALDSGEILSQKEFDVFQETQSKRTAPSFAEEVKSDMAGLKQQLRDKGYESKAEILGQAEKIIADIEQIPIEMRNQELRAFAEKIKPLKDELKALPEGRTGVRITEQEQARIKQAEAIISDIEKIGTEIKAQIAATKTPRITERKTVVAGSDKELKEAIAEIEGKLGIQPKPDKVHTRDSARIKLNELAKDVPEKTIKKNIENIKQENTKSKEQPKLAVRTNDGKVVEGKDAYNHADLVVKENISPDNIQDTGWIINGKYMSYYDMGKESIKKSEAKKPEVKKEVVKKQLTEPELKKQFKEIESERSKLHDLAANEKDVAKKKDLIEQVGKLSVEKSKILDNLNNVSDKRYVDLGGALTEYKPKSATKKIKEQKPKKEKPIEKEEPNVIQKEFEPIKEVEKEVSKIKIEKVTETGAEALKSKEYKKGDVVEHPQYGKMEILDSGKGDVVRVKTDTGTEINMSKSILEAQDIIYKKGGIDIPPDFVDRIVFGSIEKEYTRQNLRKNLAKQSQAKSEAIHNAEVLRDMWDKTPVDTNVKFMNMISEGKTSLREFESAFPGQGSFMKEIADKYRERLDEAHNLTTQSGGQLNYLENYWPGIWENPKKAASWLSGKLKKNPGFTKKKHFETIQEGLDAGLKLKFTNPEEVVLAREIAGIQHRMTLDFLSEMKDSGLMKFNRTGQPMPDGWTRIKGDVLRVFYPKVGSRGGVSLTLAGDWIMPKEAAKLVNNYLSPSLWSNQQWYGKAFRGLSETKNLFVSSILGISGFHFTETSVSSIATAQTLAAKEILRGNITVGVKDMFKAYAEPVTSMMGKGGIIEAWRTGKARTPYEKQAVDLMIRGGMRPEMSEQWQNGVNNQWKQVYRKWIKGDKLAASYRVIPAIMDAMSAPLMKHYVPRLKIHSYLRLAEDYVRMNPHLTQAEQNIGLGKIADVIDNRFGQLVYENLFVNRTLRDIGAFSSLSMGWNLGTFREFGGAAFDAGRIVIGKSSGKQIDLVDFLSGKDLKQLNATPDRILYTLFYTANFATIGALLGYAMTGKAPDEILDYFYPKTGRKNPDGSEERFQLPTMIKEFFNSEEALRKHGLIKGSIEYFNHKLNPLISSIVDLVQNQNFWGAEIRDPNASTLKQAEQIAEFMGEQVTPISIKVFMRHKDIAGENSVLPFFGFNIAKPSISRTQIQNEIYELYSKSLPQTFTKIQAEKNEKRREVKELIFKGEYVEAKSKFLELKKQGVIRGSSWSSYAKRYALPSDVRAFKGLQEEQQNYLYEKMNNQEKDKFGRYMKSKKSGRSRTRTRRRSR